MHPTTGIERSVRELPWWRPVAIKKSGVPPGRLALVFCRDPRPRDAKGEKSVQRPKASLALLALSLIFFKRILMPEVTGARSNRGGCSCSAADRVSSGRCQLSLDEVGLKGRISWVKGGHRPTSTRRWFVRLIALQPGRRELQHRAESGRVRRQTQRSWRLL